MMQKLHFRQVGCPVCGIHNRGLRRLYIPFQCVSCSRPLLLTPYGPGGVQLVPLIGVARLAVAIYALLASAALFVPAVSPKSCMEMFGFFGIAYGAIDVVAACLMVITGRVERSAVSARCSRPHIVIGMSFTSGALALLLGLVGLVLAAPMR